MAGLVPAIHVFLEECSKSWMPGTRPGMTPEMWHGRRGGSPSAEQDLRHQALRARIKSD